MNDYAINLNLDRSIFNFQSGLSYFELKLII